MNLLFGVTCCFIALMRRSAVGYFIDDLHNEGIVPRNTQNQHDFGEKLFKLFDMMYATELNTDIALQKIDNVAFNLSESVDITYEEKNFTVSFVNFTVSSSTPVIQKFECKASEPANVKNSIGDKSAAPYYKTIIEFRLKSKETSDVTNVTVHIPPKSYGNKGKINQIDILGLALTNSYNGKQFKILQKNSPTTSARDMETIKNQYTKLASLTCSQIQNEDIFNFVISNFSASSTPESHDKQTALDFDLGPVEVKSSNRTKAIEFYNYSIFRAFRILAFNVTLRGTYGKHNSQGVNEKTHFEYNIDSLKIEAILSLSNSTAKSSERRVMVYLEGFGKGTDGVRNRIMKAVTNEMYESFFSSFKNFYDELEI